MLNVLLYAPSGESPPPSPSQLLGALQRHGASMQQVAGDYHSGHWCDPATQARVDVDLGALPLDGEGKARTHHDDVNDAGTDYPGWQPLGLSCAIPLTGPHWYVVEIGLWLQELLRDLPGCGILISEDVGVEGEPGYGPGGVDRPRLLRCWEACHIEQTASLALPRLERRLSLALWRYRRESAAAAAAQPQAVWPQALLLQRGNRAHSTVLWQDPSRPLALPQVDYVVIPRLNGEQGLLPLDEVLTAAGGGRGCEHAGALLIEPSPALHDLYQRAKLMDPSPWRALSHHDWSD